MHPINIARNCTPRLLFPVQIWVVENKQDKACYDINGLALYCNMLSLVTLQEVITPILYGSDNRIHRMNSIQEARTFIRKKELCRDVVAIRSYTVMGVRPERPVKVLRKHIDFVPRMNHRADHAFDREVRDKVHANLRKLGIFRPTQNQIDLETDHVNGGMLRYAA